MPTKANNHDWRGQLRGESERDQLGLLRLWTTGYIGTIFSKADKAAMRKRIKELEKRHA